MALISKPNISIEEAEVFHDLSRLWKTNTIEIRRWEAIDHAITACAKHMHLMRLPVIGLPIDGLDSNASICRRFYNETVEFIRGGRRQINITIWEGLINDATKFAESYRYESRHGSSGSIGGKNNFYSFSNDTSTPISSSFGTKSQDIRNDLLSYAHQDVLHQWIHRPNGIDDMLQSLVLMTKIYWAYGNLSLRR